MKFDNKILKFAKVLKRYEPCIEDGTYFVYNYELGKIWTGNFSSKVLLDLFDGTRTIAEIKKKFQQLLDIEDVEIVDESVDIIVKELLDIQMLTEVWFNVHVCRFKESFRLLF